MGTPIEPRFFYKRIGMDGTVSEASAPELSLAAKIGVNESSETKMRGNDSGGQKPFINFLLFSGK